MNRPTTSALCLTQLTYISTAARVMSGNQLNALLDKARTFNRSQAITGILIYVDGSFLQILEGEEAAVLALYGRIKSDPRHIGVRTMMMRTVSQGAFINWSMGFKVADDLSASEQLACAELFATSKGPAHAITSDRTTDLIVRTFISNHLALKDMCHMGHLKDTEPHDP